MITNCIGCGHENISRIGSLGKLPSCNHFEKTYESAVSLPKYELDLVECGQCHLVQLGTHLPITDMFGENYPYFSSLSTAWLDHCYNAAHKHKETFGVTEHTKILEIGSNDGYMLKNFSFCKTILGIEPSMSTAKVAIKNGVPTLVSFFDDQLAQEIENEHGKFDLILSNNMMAHTPNLQSVLNGIKRLLSSKGTVVVEVQYATEMFSSVVYDTIYHEHFCYYTLKAARSVFEYNGLFVYDVEFLPTHGGSIRIYANLDKTEPADKLKKLYEAEEEILQGKDLSSKFFDKAYASKNEILSFINKEGPIVAYGAPTKGNVFMNFCGLTDREIEFTCDSSPLKQNRYCPGTGVKVHATSLDKYQNKKNILILPWNIKREIMKLFRNNVSSNPKLFTAIPHLEKLELVD